MHGINAKGTPKRNRAVPDKTDFLTLRSLLIFVVFVSDEISKGMIVTIEEEPSEYFQ